MTNALGILGKGIFEASILTVPVLKELDFYVKRKKKQ